VLAGEFDQNRGGAVFDVDQHPVSELDTDSTHDRSAKQSARELRWRNRQLEMENDVLERAAAYFARENVLPSNVPTGPRVGR
jgi:transposase-like protein